MRKPTSVATLNDLGRIRLSKTFFMRDFLFSDIAAIHGLPNVPDDPDLAIRAGTRLCEDLLEPLQDRFGRIAIRSAYRSCEVNGLGKRTSRSYPSSSSITLLTSPISFSALVRWAGVASVLMLSASWALRWASSLLRNSRR